MDVVTAKSVKPKPVHWLWKGRVPAGMISVVAGRPDQGKGLFCSYLAAEVSKRPGKGKVLYSAVEDPRDLMTRPRLEAAGADLDRVVLGEFILPTQMEELATIVRRENIRLVIMDPFNAHLSGVSRFNDAIRKVTSPLAKLADQTGCAIVIVEHARKDIGPKVHPLAGIGGGGSGLVAAARMGFVFGTDPEDRDRKILCTVKSNIRELPEPVAFDVDVDTEQDTIKEVPMLLYTGETAFDARRLLASQEAGTPGRKPDKRAEADEWLTMHLFSQPNYTLPAGKVYEDAKQYAITQKTLLRAASDMGVIKDPPKGGRNVTWTLPPDLVQLLKTGGVTPNDTP